MTSRVRHRAVDLLMTLYQTLAVALGTLLCGSAQNSRIPATSTLIVRQAEASHKRQLIQVDSTTYVIGWRRMTYRTCACISAGMHPQRPSASREGAAALPGTLRKKLMTAYAQLNADPQDLLADHELTVGK